MDNDSIGEYEPYDCVFDFAFLNEFFSSGIEDSPLVSNASVSNTFDEMTHFDLNLETHQLDLKDENARWIKRRRFKKGTEEYILRKREIRLQNRISARKSIEKKQAHIRELEVKVSKLKAETEFRKRVAQIFPNSKPAGRLCRLRRAFSMSDFYFPTQVAAEEANQLGEPVGRYPANYEKIS